jgi:hypothetical protein
MDSDCGRHRDAAAFVLGDLRGAALVEYERHLRSCATCQEDVDLLRTAETAIPLMASPPPEPADPEEDEPDPIMPGVWAQERIAAVNAPKHPTLREIAEAAAPPPARPVRLPRPPAQAGPRNRLARVVDLLEFRPITRPRRPKPSRRRTTTRRVWGSAIPGPIMAGIAALAIAAILVIILTKEGQSIGYVKAQIAWQNGAAVVKTDGAHGQLLVVGMPAAPSGTGYELWGIKRGVKTEIPLVVRIGLNKKGEGGVVIPGDVRNYLALVVYAEPPGGTVSPNGAPYVVANLRKPTKQ